MTDALCAKKVLHCSVCGRELAEPHTWEDCARGLRKRLDELEWRVVHNAGRMRELVRPRWAHVSSATAHGSGESRAMCRRHGTDPEELIGDGYEYTGEE